MSVEMNVPTSARAYAAAVESLAGGKFTSRFKESARLMFATMYGAPFFAINQLAPELNAKSDLSLLFEDTGGWYAQAGGRWLSLYAKTRQPSRKYSITVCTSRRPNFRKLPKPILIQPHQQVLLKSVNRHLRDLDALPDLTLVPVPAEFEQIVTMATSLQTVTAGHKILVACQMHAEALIVGALFRAFGYGTSEVISFGLDADNDQPFTQCAWWLSVTVPTEDVARKPGEDDVVTLRQAYLWLQKHLGRATGSEQIASIAATFATRTTVTTGDQTIQAVLVPPVGGIDLKSGQWLGLDADLGLTGSQSSIHGITAVDADLLAEAPPGDAPNLSNEGRLSWLLWVSRVLSRLDNSEPDQTDQASSTTPEPVADQPAESIPGPATAPGAQGVKPSQPDEPASAPESGAMPSASIAIRPPRPRLSRRAGAVNVLAFAAQLGQPNQPAQQVFDKTRERILRWLNNKGFHTADPLGNNHVESSDGEVTIESDRQTVWALRFDDRRYMENGAIWRVEATLINGSHAAMGMRLIQVRSSEDTSPPVVSGVPSVVAHIARDIGLADAGMPLLNSATRMSGQQDAHGLSRLLLNAERVQPVIVAAGDIDTSADRLAKRLTGVAHVVCIDSSISQQLIRQFGRERAVYGHAIRLYRPGFSSDADPYLHPVWPLRSNQPPRWLLNDLFEDACAISLITDDLDERVPPFQAIHRHLAAQRLQSSKSRLQALQEQFRDVAASKDEQISQLTAIREELEATLSEYQAKTSDFDAQLSDLQQELLVTRNERDEAREDLRQFQYRYQNQWEAEDPTTDEADDPYYPDSWDELEEWVEVYGEERLVLLPQAAKAARDSPFKNVSLAYKALDYLVRYYVPMRTRDPEDTAPYQASQEALAEYGLELSNVGTAVDDRRYKQDYRRQYEGNDILLDQHLKSGVGFDPAAIFRLYFWYDKDAAKVVVGHMPTHLTNRTTHSG